MIVTSLEDIQQSRDEVDNGDFLSRRMILSKDGMGYSVHETHIPPALQIDIVLEPVVHPRLRRKDPLRGQTAALAAGPHRLHDELPRGRDNDAALSLIHRHLLNIAQFAWPLAPADIHAVVEDGAADAVRNAQPVLAQRVGRIDQPRLRDMSGRLLIGGRPLTAGQQKADQASHGGVTHANSSGHVA